MAAWLDGRKVCVALPLVGLLSFCLYSMMLSEPKRRLKQIHYAAKDDENLFDLDNGINNSFNEFIPPTHLRYSTARKNTTERSMSDKLGRRPRRRLPNAIIIGVRKGGTRALLEFLKLHPKIKACSTEVHFFDVEENYQLDLDWYRRKMPKSLPGDITIEKTPAYFVTDKVPERVQQMSTDVKLIVTLRDPTERAISDYVQVFTKKRKRSQSFEEFITQDKEQKILKTSTKTVQVGVYIKHLRNWLKYFPLSQLHFVSMEEMKVNPAKELQAVEKFLNIEPFIKKEHFYINETKHFPCVTMPDKTKGENAGCLSETKGRPHPTVRNDIRTLLQNYYRPYNLELYKKAQRDFHWP